MIQAAKWADSAQSAKSGWGAPTSGSGWGMKNIDVKSGWGSTKSKGWGKESTGNIPKKIEKDLLEFHFGTGKKFTAKIKPNEPFTKGINMPKAPTINPNLQNPNQQAQKKTEETGPDDENLQTNPIFDFCGEENDEYLIDTQSKLNILTSDKTNKTQWTTKGSGPFRITRTKDTHIVRMLLRRKPMMQVIINTQLYPEMKPEAKDGKIPMIRFGLFEGDKLNAAVLYFKDKETRDTVLEVWKRELANLKQ